jgi:hypothetical protein
MVRSAFTSNRRIDPAPVLLGTITSELRQEGYKSETVQAKCIYSAKVTEITLVAPRAGQ